MKLITSVGPNPRVVHVFIAEKGLDVPREDIDIMSGANRQPDHLAKNPWGQSPALELDDGSVIAEIVPICEYLDETSEGDSLIGNTAQQRAETRMWVRRLDLNILEPLTNGFRSSEGLALFKDRIRCMPDAAADLKAIAQDNLAKLEPLLEGREFVCGDRFSLADITLACFLEFGTQVGQPLNPEFSNINAWFERVSQRPSFAA